MEAGGVEGGEEEWGELEGALEDTLSDRGRLVALVGGAGIGRGEWAERYESYEGVVGSTRRKRDATKPRHPCCCAPRSSLEPHFGPTSII